MADLSESVGACPILNSVTREPSPLEAEVAGLFEELRAPLLRYLVSFPLPEPEGEEIIQEAFLELFRHLRAGRSRANLRGWVFRVTHHLALKSKTRIRRQSEIFTYDPELAKTLADDRPGPESNFADRQRQDRLLAVVRAMPEQDRWCLSLRAEGLRYREIAEIVGISLGSVAGSIEKSLARLMRAEQTREQMA
jgi:RNA polymerase sigma-70 factor (ECF subfamily)